MEEDGAERVDADLIRKVYVERMRPLHPAIRVLQSGDPRLMDQFDDLYRNAYPRIDRTENDINAVPQSLEEESANDSEAGTSKMPSAKKDRDLFGALGKQWRKPQCLRRSRSINSLLLTPLAISSPFWTIHEATWIPCC